MTVAPGRVDELRARYGGNSLSSRRIQLGDDEDPFEALHQRGFTDGLPCVPPTPERVLAILQGTSRDPGDVVASVPPDLVSATIEKVAINAVLAGCRPDHLPVVLAAVEAACTDDFNAHGVLATTMAVGPIVIVHGSIGRSIGINSGVNALGQGTRANVAIGRALQLVIRNVGGGRPGAVDRATHGNPGKLGLAFAEDEHGSPWEPLAVARGIRPGRSAVTVFAGEGPRTIVDQHSRTADALADALAAGLAAVHHPNARGVDALLVVGPEHARVFAGAAWSRERLMTELDARNPGKVRTGGLLVMHAGGQAGLFSAVIGGWLGGARGSEPVTREVDRWL